MAAQRALELHHPNEFAITASAPMAGSYDLSGVTTADFLSGRAVPNPYYFAYLLAAYRLIYPGLGSWEEIFQPPYATDVPPLLNGRHDGDAVNQAMSYLPREVLSASFIEAFEKDPQHPFRLALRENDLLNWTPSSPLRLFHCRGDQDVTYANAEVALAYFHEHGAMHVELIDPNPTADHEDGFLPCMLAATAWFATFEP